MISLHRLKGGIHAPEKKETAELSTQLMPVPQTVIIPMQQHIGRPCALRVKKGDTVKVGQVIGDSDSMVSAPIHSSVSGTVTGIGSLLLPSGQTTETTEIQPDGLQQLHEDIRPPKVDNAEQLLEAVRASGLVGLGGAGFPAHVKLAAGSAPEVNTLIINAAECEPYITSDYRECMENTQDVIDGINQVKRLLDIPNVYIAVEDNKPKAYETFKAAAGNDVTVCRLKTRYPQGAEKVLIYTVTGKRVPAGKLPADVGVLVMNVTSIGFLARYLKTGIPLIDKRITVDGSAIAQPMNLRVPLGTLVADIIQFCGGYKEPPVKLLMGGPMMGIALYSDQIPLLKQNNAILAFGKKEAAPAEESACIRCGRCVEACPMSLMPPVVANILTADNTEILKRLSPDICIECGCCAYVCPANRHLVQTMRLAKAEHRKVQVSK